MKLPLAFLFFLSLYYYSEAVHHKRETFCQDNRCLTCIGRYCTTTCQGAECAKCPLGECCNGSNCNICRGEKCCGSAECNNCIVACLKKCIGKTTCHYDCFQECLPNSESGNGENKSSHYGPLISNYNNYLPTNVTTIINITNELYNKNDIYNPILVNSTNVNNYTGNQNTYHRKHIILDGNKDVKPTNRTKENCCELVHPERCQIIAGESNNSLCFTGKHKECSDICIGKHVHIIEDNEQKHQCVAISQPPYFFCGNYLVENCDNCYCTDIDNPDCGNEEKCNKKCKDSILDEEFYNVLYTRE